MEGDLSKHMTKMEDTLAEVLVELRALRSEVAETKEIVEAWRSVKLWAQFGKWVAGLLAAVGTSAAAWKAWLK